MHKRIHLPRLRTPDPQYTAQGVTLAYEDAMRSSSDDASVRRSRAGSILSSGDHRKTLLALARNSVGESSVAVAPGADDSHTIIEYMCVCGIHERRPKVLACIPADATPDPNLPLFCFPEGVPPDLPMSNLGDQISEFDSTRDSFLFSLTGTTVATQQVFVVRSLELLDDLPPWMPPNSVRRGSLIGPRHLTARAYCIVTKQPYARLMWRLLWEFVRHERRRIVVTEERHRVRQQQRLISFAKIIENLSTARYPPDQLIQLKSSGCFSEGVISFRTLAPSQTSRVALACVFLPILLRALSPCHVSTLMTAVLTESKVIVVGRTPGRVSSCVFALAVIIAPFCWQGSLLPVLPQELIDCLCAPTPFIAGHISSSMQLPDGAEPQLGDRVVVVDIDTNQLVLHGSPLPQLPQSDVLESCLMESHLWLRTGHRVLNDMCEDDRPFGDPNEREAIQFESATEALNRYTVWLIDCIRSLLPDNSWSDDPHLPSTVLKCVAPENVDFMDALINTQHFQFISRTFGDMPPPDPTAGAPYKSEKLACKRAFHLA